MTQATTNLGKKRSNQNLFQDLVHPQSQSQGPKLSKVLNSDYIFDSHVFRAFLVIFSTIFFKKRCGGGGHLIFLSYTAGVGRQVRRLGPSPKKTLFVCPFPDTKYCIFFPNLHRLFYRYELMVTGLFQGCELSQNMSKSGPPPLHLQRNLVFMLTPMVAAGELLEAGPCPKLSPSHPQPLNKPGKDFHDNILDCQKNYFISVSNEHIQYISLFLNTFA